MREVGDSRDGCESLKTDPLKFFRRFSQPLMVVLVIRPCNVIQNCIHVHAHENCRGSAAVRLSNTLTSENTLERSVPFLSRFFITGCVPHRYRGNKSPRLALLSSSPITVANANNTEHRDELDPYR